MATKREKESNGENAYERTQRKKGDEELIKKNIDWLIDQELYKQNRELLAIGSKYLGCMACYRNGEGKYTRKTKIIRLDSTDFRGDICEWFGEHGISSLDGMDQQNHENTDLAGSKNIPLGILKQIISHKKTYGKEYHIPAIYRSRGVTVQDIALSIAQTDPEAIERSQLSIGSTMPKQLRSVAV